MKKKKKALGERIRRAGLWLVDFKCRIIDKIPVWKRVGHLDYYYLPCDILAYLHRYEPEKEKKVLKVFEWIVTILSSVAGSLIGIKLALWYFTTHI